MPFFVINSMKFHIYHHTNKYVIWFNESDFAELIRPCGHVLMLHIIYQITSSFIRLHQSIAKKIRCKMILILLPFILKEKTARITVLNFLLEILKNKATRYLLFLRHHLKFCYVQMYKGPSIKDVSSKGEGGDSKIGIWGRFSRLIWKARGVRVVKNYKK